MGSLLDGTSGVDESQVQLDFLSYFLFSFTRNQSNKKRVEKSQKIIQQNIPANISLKINKCDTLTVLTRKLKRRPYEKKAK